MTLEALRANYPLLLCAATTVFGSIPSELLSFLKRRLYIDVQGVDTCPRGEDDPTTTLGRIFDRDKVPPPDLKEWSAAEPISARVTTQQTRGFASKTTKDWGIAIRLNDTVWSTTEIGDGLEKRVYRINGTNKVYKVDKRTLKTTPFVEVPQKYDAAAVSKALLHDLVVPDVDVSENKDRSELIADLVKPMSATDFETHKHDVLALHAALRGLGMRAVDARYNNLTRDENGRVRLLDPDWLLQGESVLSDDEIYTAFKDGDEATLLRLQRVPG